MANDDLKIELEKCREEKDKLQALFDEILKEKNKLDLLIENMADEVWFADQDKNFTLANPAASRAFNVELKKTGHLDMKTFINGLVVLRSDGTPRPLEESPVLRALNGESIKNYEEIVKLPVSGELQYRRVNAAPVMDDKNNIIGVVSVVHDITDLKNAMRELSAIFELSADMITVARPDGYFTRVNPAWEKILGFSNAEIMKLGFIGLIHPDDLQPTLDEVKKQLAGGTTANFINRYRCKDGTYKKIEWNATAAINGNLYAIGREIGKDK